MKRRGELRLVEQAIRQRWDITAKGRHDAIELVREVLDDSDATLREKLRACSVAILMEQSNLLDDEDDDLLSTVKRKQVVTLNAEFDVD
jgi:hypothetical protein